MASAFFLMADGADQVRAELRRRTRRRGSAKRVAHELGITASQLSRIALGRLAPPEHVAERLGFRRIVRFERVE
jgi:transcriptional regulator with XRE-family HTH domain